MKMKRIARLALVAVLAMMLLVQCAPVLAESTGDTRWADAADEIDRFLDAAFESYLDGDPSAAYTNVSNAYFRVYETTGFDISSAMYLAALSSAVPPISPIKTTASVSLSFSNLFKIST